MVNGPREVEKYDDLPRSTFTTQRPDHASNDDSCPQDRPHCYEVELRHGHTTTKSEKAHRELQSAFQHSYEPNNLDSLVLIQTSLSQHSHSVHRIMAPSLKFLVAAVIVTGFNMVHTAPTVAQGFKNDLSIANLFISNPIEADVTSSYNSTLSGMSNSMLMVEGINTIQYSL